MPLKSPVFFNDYSFSLAVVDCLTYFPTAVIEVVVAQLEFSGSRPFPGIYVGIPDTALNY